MFASLSFVEYSTYRQRRTMMKQIREKKSATALSESETGKCKNGRHGRVERRKLKKYLCEGKKMQDKRKSAWKSK